MKKILLMLLLFNCFALFIYSQQTITGTVKDGGTGENLPGVNVSVKGTMKGTITDLDGKYTIDIAEGENILVYSFVGFITKEIEIGDKTVIDVVLETDVSELDEVVVIGYGVQKKSLVTGAIAKVDAEDLAKTSQPRVESAIQGKTAGVTVMQQSGAPGSALTIRVRGTGSNYDASPLVIVDGMRLAKNAMDHINPSDIQSVEILKDAASTAIYGAEGGNGVIIITTKSGVKDRTEVTYKYTYGVQKMTNKVELMNAQQYTDYFREAIYYESLVNMIRDNPGISLSILTPIAETQVENSRYPKTPMYDTDWIDAITESAPREEHYVSIVGGSEKSNYFLSLGKFSQAGIIGGKDNSNFNRATVRLNLNTEVNKWLSADAKISYSNSKWTSFTNAENSEFGGLISNAAYMDPLTPVNVPVWDSLSPSTQSMYREFFGAGLDEKTQTDLAKESTAIQNEDGFFGVSDILIGEYANPVAQLHNSHYKRSREDIAGSIGINFTPIKGLKHRTQIDFSSGGWAIEQWNPSVKYNTTNQSSSSIFKYMDQRQTIQFEDYITYNLKAGKHDVTGLVGGTYFYGKNQSLFGTSTGMQEETDEFAYLSAGLNTTDPVLGNLPFGERRLISYFGRLSYDYAEKYIFQGVYRIDGSSLFGPENRYATFPSFQVGWVVSNESFFDVDFINLLKLRYSWGNNGSLSNLTDYQWSSLIVNFRIGNNGQVTPFSNYDALGQPVPATEPRTLSNPALTWENSKQTDFGIDISFFDNQVTFTADYFKKVTEDLLAQGGTPLYSGNIAPWTNAGEVINEGYEFELGFKKKLGDLNINLFTNASHVKNEVSYYLTEDQFLLGANFGLNPLTRMEPGYPIWSFFGFETLGIFQTQEEIDNHTNSTGTVIQPKAMPGDVKFVDQNDDGALTTADDYVYLGDPWPEWTIGFTTNIEYKGFDLSAFFYASIGNEVFNGLWRTEYTRLNKPIHWYKDRYYDDPATPEIENPSNKFFRATYDESVNNYRISDLFVEDGSFFKLRSLEIGYTMPVKAMEKTPFTNFRIYASGLNLFTITKYRGMDPEIGNSDLNIDQQSFNSVGVDKGLYPQSSTYMVGFSVNF